MILIRVEIYFLISLADLNESIDTKTQNECGNRTYITLHYITLHYITLNYIPTMWF